MFAILDIETSGFRPGIHEILQSHVILSDGVKIIDELTSSFKPKIIRPDYHKAFDIHGITIRQARSFPNKTDSLFSLLDFIPDNSIMVCHSKRVQGYFDYGFLAMEYEFIDKRIEFNKLFKTCLSTHTLAKKFTKSKKLKLNELCLEYNISLNHHDAKSDAHACFELFKIFYGDNKDEIIKSCEYY